MIYLIFREWFDGTAEETMGYCKTEEAAIKWMDDNRPKKNAGYQYWYEECESLGVDESLTPVNKQILSQVHDQVSDQVWSQVQNQVWVRVQNQVSSQVSSQVQNQVWVRVWDKIR